jgi:hypothetical protein
VNIERPYQDPIRRDAPPPSIYYHGKEVGQAFQPDIAPESGFPATPLNMRG